MAWAALTKFRIAALGRGFVDGLSGDLKVEWTDHSFEAMTFATRAEAGKKMKAWKKYGIPEHAGVVPGPNNEEKGKT
jgi:hypothetical protein